jgi:hypothetical protein
MSSKSSRRKEVHDRLRRLAEGELSPAEAADWASRTMAEDVEFDDLTWDGLDRLAGADLLTDPGEYLHGPADFAAWLEQFEQSRT